MSSSSGVKIRKFGQKLGFKSQAKGANRYELIYLLGQVAIYQPDPMATELTRSLNGALLKLDDTTGKVEDQVKSASEVANSVRNKIEELKKQKQQQESSQSSKKPGFFEKRDIEAAQKKLQKELDEVLGLTNPGLQNLKLVEPELGFYAVLAEGERIRAEIFARNPLEGRRKDDLSAQILTHGKRMSRANGRFTTERNFLDGPARKELNEAKQLLQVCNNSVGGSYEGPLARSVEVLEMNLSATPVDPMVVRSLLTQVAEARKSIKDDPKYIETSHAKGVGKKNSQELKKLADEKMKPLEANIEFLRVSGAPEYDTIANGINGIYDYAGQEMPSQGMQRAKGEVIRRVNELSKLAETMRNSLTQTIANDGEATQKALVEAKNLYKTLHDKYAANKALQSDWKAIEAELGSAEELVPATGQIPKTVTVKDLNLAKGLAEKALTHLKAIQTDELKIKGFDLEMDTLKKSLEERTFFGRLRGNEQGVLEKYAPDKRKEFEEQLSALVNKLESTPAKTAMETFAKLKADAERAVQDLKPTIDYIDQTAKPLLKKMEELQGGWDMAIRPGPKTFVAALKGLEAQIKLQPPVLSALQTAFATATTEFNKVETATPETLKKQVGTDKQSDKDAEKKLKLDRSAQLKLLEPLGLLYDSTANAVNAVGGDQNALKAAKTLLDQLQSEIEKGTVFTPEENAKRASKRETLKARLNLLLSNPAGEVNRKRADLPKVIAELEKAIEGASNALRTAKNEINGHSVPEDAEAKDNVVDLIEAYIDLLGSEVGDLARVGKPVMDVDNLGQGEREKVREEALRILRSFRARLRKQPMTSELLRSPFPEVKKSIGPVFQGLDKYEFTLMTCI